jgi:hypothetical protein
MKDEICAANNPRRRSRVVGKQQHSAVGRSRESAATGENEHFDLGRVRLLRRRPGRCFDCWLERKVFVYKSDSYVIEASLH